MADDLIFEFRTPTDKLKADLANARGEVRKFGADVKSDVSSFAENLNGLLEGVGSKLNTGLKIALGDFGLAVEKLNNLTEDAIKLIPVVGEGLAGAYHELSGTMLDAAQRGLAFNDSLKQQQIQLGLVAGSASDVKRELSEISDIAFKTNTSRGFLVNALEDLQLFNVDAERALYLLRGLANQATATGGGDARVASVTDLIERVLETGKVDTRTVRQFIRNKIPIYDILSEELQVSKKRAMQLLQSGTLSGDDLITVLSHAFNKPKWENAAEEMTQTVDGLSRRYTASVNKLLGTIEQPLHADVTDILRRAVDTVHGSGAAGVAESMRSGLSAANNLILGAGNALLGGDLYARAGKVGEDIKAGLQTGVVGAGLDFAKSYLGEFAKGIGAQSPATEFIPLGVYSAQGWKIGFLDELQKDGGVMGLFQGGRGPLGGQLSREQIIKLIRERTAAAGIDPDIAVRQLARESANFNPRYVYGPGRSPAGAEGLAQFMPGTWATYGKGGDPFNPSDAIDAYVRYMTKLLNQFGGRYDLALAGYNSGESRKEYARAASEGRPIDFSVLPRGVREQTPDYVNSLLRNTGAVDELTAAVRDLAASTNWRIRGDKSPDEGKGRFQDLSPADQLKVIQGMTGFNAPPVSDLQGGTGMFARGGSVDWSGVDFGKLDEKLWGGSDDGGLEAGLKAMADAATLAGSHAKDAGVYIEGVGDVAQSEVIPALQTMFALMVDNQHAVEDFGRKGGDELEKVKARVNGLGESFREMGFTTEHLKGIFGAAVDDALAHAREGWKSSLKAFGADWARAIEEMLVKAATAKLADKLFGTGGAGGAGGGNPFDSLFGGLKKLFGLGGGSSTSRASSSAGGPSVDPSAFAAEFGDAPANSAASAGLSANAAVAALMAGYMIRSKIFGPSVRAALGDSGFAKALAPFVSDPMMSIIGTPATIALALFGLKKKHATEKALRKAIRETADVDISEMDLLTQIKQIGEQAFGKGQVRKHIYEVIRLDEVQQLIDDYGERTGQGKPKLPHEFLYNAAGPRPTPITVNGSQLMPSPFSGARRLTVGGSNAGGDSSLAAAFDDLKDMQRRQMTIQVYTTTAIRDLAQAAQTFKTASPEDVLIKGSETTHGIRAVGVAAHKHLEHSFAFKEAIASVAWGGGSWSTGYD
jgi:tape measure domain-containing protein